MADVWVCIVCRNEFTCKPYYKEAEEQVCSSTCMWKLNQYRRDDRFCADYPMVRADLLSYNSPKAWFDYVYRDNAWCSQETRSGYGSELKATENLREELKYLVQCYRIKSIFDAGCGDFNWMKELLPDLDVTYIGGDIVDDMIASNIKQYEKPSINFRVHDVTADPISKVDLLLCRDVLFHLSMADVAKAISNFKRSGASYFLTTTYTKTENQNIKTGDYWPINLFAKPYYFPKPLYQFVDGEDHGRIMGLWSMGAIS